jgi:hypothetical protein
VRGVEAVSFALAISALENNTEREKESNMTKGSSGGKGGGGKGGGGKGGGRPPNGPSTTGKPSGGGRGNNPPSR